MDITETGGSSLSCTSATAHAIAEGKCKVALIHPGGPSRNGGNRLPAPGAVGPSPQGLTNGPPEQGFETIYGGSARNIHAMCAQRHMHEYETTSEQPARINGTASHHAQWNQRALEVKNDYTSNDIDGFRLRLT